VASRRTLRRPSIGSFENKPYDTKPVGELGQVSFFEPSPPAGVAYGSHSLDQACHSPFDPAREPPFDLACRSPVDLTRHPPFDQAREPPFNPARQPPSGQAREPPMNRAC
jgi:hypothetical protein